jgi:hypothetical protein
MSRAAGPTSPWVSRFVIKMPANRADNSELPGLEREQPAPVPSPSLSLRAAIAVWVSALLAADRVRQHKRLQAKQKNCAG